MRYKWLDLLTNVEVEVDRPMSQIEVGPSLQEVTEQTHLTEDEYKSAKWERLISGGQTKIYGKGWGSARKGSYNSKSY